MKPVHIVDKAAAMLWKNPPACYRHVLFECLNNALMELSTSAGWGGFKPVTESDGENALPKRYAALIVGTVVWYYRDNWFNDPTMADAYPKLRDGWKDVIQRESMSKIKQARFR